MRVNIILLFHHFTENKPFGYHSAITANAAMDISAAKDVINMYTEMLNYTKVDGYEQAVSEAEALLRMLPDFYV